MRTEIDLELAHRVFGHRPMPCQWITSGFRAANRDHGRHEHLSPSTGAEGSSQLGTVGTSFLHLRVRWNLPDEFIQHGPIHYPRVIEFLEIPPVRNPELRADHKD